MPPNAWLGIVVFLEVDCLPKPLKTIWIVIVPRSLLPGSTKSTGMNRQRLMNHFPPRRMYRWIMKRGDIWWASLPTPMGPDPGYRYPVLVIQSAPFNRSRIATVLIAVITSNLALGEAPGNVHIAKSDSGLPKASVVNVSRILTVDRQLLTSRIRALPDRVMRHVDEGLKLVLGL
uniref:mRNA-degrading endonuclease, toxin component of the MazEF toxin-antitoxin module n=1 Tax=Candidatus Kentrum sp. FW TaxID=2126338 RepID=A0A450TKZ6_9GAMM|nr:MAG: mRNA-degrading endonuclease, toxin component of the MazEF toxin-antitoxin module [Candidatus Kentron sp. FW]